MSQFPKHDAYGLVERLIREAIDHNTFSDELVRELRYISISMREGWLANAPTTQLGDHKPKC